MRMRDWLTVCCVAELVFFVNVVVLELVKRFFQSVDAVH